MLPSLANLERDTGTPARESQEGTGTEGNEPKRARKERRTPILVDGEWVRHYRHAPLYNASIRRAVDALLDPGQVAVVTAKYGPVAEWDVSEVTDFAYLFAHSIGFTADLSGWDVGNATDMDHMFRGATNFTSDLSKWNVGNVYSMDQMFSGATRFTSDLSRWDVGNVESMDQMFAGAERFTSDLSRWDVGNVESMGATFFGAHSFTSDLSTWDVGKVTNMRGTFSVALRFGPPLDLGEDGEWTPESLAKHVAFVESSPVLKTYRARRRWREVRELWYVAWSVVRALLVRAEERSIDEKRYDPENPAVRQQLEEELENMWKDLGLVDGFATRARRLCEILLQTNHSPPTQTRCV